jgi:carbohydrate-selective porin OprB
MTRKAPPVVVGCVLAACIPALAKPSASAPSEAGVQVEAMPKESDREEALQTPFDILENGQLTGDWWKARKWLEGKGIEFSLSLTTVYQQNFRGGLDTHNGHDITGSVDYELSLDFEAMGLWKGGILYTLAESGWNEDIGFDKVGSLSGVNGDAYLGDRAIQVSELWYQHTFLDGKVRAKAGKMDLTVDFDLNAYANDETSQFLNPELVNAVGVIPPYSQGAMLAITPIEWFYVQAAIADGQANSSETGFNTFYHDQCYTMSVFEFGFLPVWETSAGRLPGGYRFELWYDPQPRPVLVGTDEEEALFRLPTQTDNVVFVFNMDQMLFKERPAEAEDAQGLGVFFRYARARDDTSLRDDFWSVGAQYQGLIPTRDDDVLGFGFAQSLIGRRAKALALGDRESVYELYYNIAVCPWLAITPDFQYIQQPSGDATIPDSFVAGLRVQMSF